MGKEVNTTCGEAVVGFEASAGVLVAVVDGSIGEEVVAMPPAMVNNVKSVVACAHFAGAKIILDNSSSLPKRRAGCGDSLGEVCVERWDCFKVRQSEGERLHLQFLKTNHGYEILLICVHDEYPVSRYLRYRGSELLNQG